MVSQVQEQVEQVRLRHKEEEGWKALEKVVAEGVESKAEADVAWLMRQWEHIAGGPSVQAQAQA